MPSATAEPPVAPPIIVAKVNDQGTPESEDDRIVGGASFEFRRDDGDSLYEPSGGDAPVLAHVEATFGFAVWTPPGPGSYWVTEVAAPPGLTTAQPILVQYTVPATAQNCAVVNGTSSCVRDEDQSGGFVTVVVTDSPSGGVSPETSAPTLPATDTSPIGRPNSNGLLVVIGIVFILCVAVLAATPHRRSR